MSHKKTFFEQEYDSNFAFLLKRSAPYSLRYAMRSALCPMLSAFVRLSSEFCYLSSVFEPDT
jgi:hypothetical protein